MTTPVTDIHEGKCFRSLKVPVDVLRLAAARQELVERRILSLGALRHASVSQRQKVHDVAYLRVPHCVFDFLSIQMIALVGEQRLSAGMIEHGRPS